jgi:hypothetical protein
VAVQTNWEMFSGDDEILTASVLDDSGGALSLATATEILFVVRESPSSTDEVFSKKIGSGVEITDEAGGEYEITIDAADTEGLDGVYSWTTVISIPATGDFTAAFGYLAIKGKAIIRGAYCELEEALALIADVQITVNTTPSLATAAIIVETIARDIDGVLMGRGYALPVESTQALNFLRTTNQYGACAAIIKSKKPIDTGMGGDRGAFGYYDAAYKRNLTMIASPTFSLFGSGSETDETGFQAGWSETVTDPDANTDNIPFWTRHTEF